MDKVFVIATSKTTDEEGSKTIFDALKKAIPGLKGMKWVNGPHCTNVGVCGEITNEEIHQLTLAFMPSKCSEARDEPWTGNIYELKEEI